MIFGDPFHFAVSTEYVVPWNNNFDFCNGLIHFYIDGMVFPIETINATLACEIHMLSERLSHLPVDMLLYEMEKNEAFRQLYDLVYPADPSSLNDYRFEISPASFSDNNYIILAVSNGTNVRIMGAKLKYNVEKSRHDLNDVTIREAIVDNNLLVEISKKIIQWLDGRQNNKETVLLS